MARKRPHPVGLIDLKTLKAVAEGFNEKAGGGRIRWYSQEAWAERDEPYGQGSVLTALIEDNGLGMLLNRAETDYAYALQDQFYSAVAALGWHAELGTSWSLHFYRGMNAEQVVRLANPVEYLTNPRVLAPGTPVEIRATDYEGTVRWLESEVRFRQIEYGEKGYRLSAPWTMDGYRFYPDAEFGRLWRLRKT